MAISLSFELDKFSGDADEFGDSIRTFEFVRCPLITCEFVLRFCGDEIGAIEGRVCDCAAKMAGDNVI